MRLTIMCLGCEKQNKRLYISPYLEVIFHLTKCSIVITKISLFPFAKMLHCNHKNIIISLCQNTLTKQKKQPNPELPFWWVAKWVPLPFLVCFCLFWVTTKSWTKWAPPTLFFVFFSFLFIDHKELNKMSFPNFLFYLLPIFWR
jgi:hypothetical protein